ncbi:MAG: hypothetical protein IKN43_09880 [Selenomonadaceae bacterium]|nr:hypothetical protein [Selenomonadaceae bacterium]
MEQTVISSVDGNNFIDSFGRRLVRIGNMTIRAGDVVWTDGRCIYGNMLHGNRTPATFAYGDDFEGVPLNAYDGTLYIYTRDHKIKRYISAYSSYFCNNGKDYYLQKSSDSQGSVDIDIGNDNKGWEIKCIGAGYNAYRGAGIEVTRKKSDGEVVTGKYSYGSKNANAVVYSQGSKHWDAKSVSTVTTSFSSEAHPERNYTNTETITRVAYEYSSFKDVLGFSHYVNDWNVQFDKPIEIWHDGKCVREFQLKDFLKNCNEALNAIPLSYGAKGTSSVVTEVRISGSTCNIDTQGNWKVIISARVVGYKFATLQTTRPYFERTQTITTVDSAPKGYAGYTWDTHETRDVYTSTTVSYVPQSRTATIKCDVSVQWLVENGKIIDHIYSYGEITYYPRIHYTCDTFWVSEGAFGDIGNILQPFYDEVSHFEGTGGLQTLGIFLQDSGSCTRTPVEYLNTEGMYIELNAEKKLFENKDYEFPIQDNFYWKTNNGRSYMQAVAYQNGALVADGKDSSGVYSIVCLNPRKGEYLFRGGDNAVYVIRNGKVSRVMYNKHPIFVRNKRLRFINRKTSLKKSKL